MKYNNFKVKLFILGVCLCPSFLLAQNEKQKDSTAIYILDKMADVIGDLQAVQFSMETSVDELNAHGELSTYFAHSEVSMVGPNKFTAIVQGDKGEYGYWYDGDYLSYYSYNENNYVTLEAPDTILTMIDSMHVAYDFKFPAADFFYPNFTDDIIEGYDTVRYMGKRLIDDTPCFYITAANSEMQVQLWVTNDSQMLPKKLLIVYKNDHSLQYEATFEKWILNPDIPESIFSFTPPPNAKLISILAKS